MDQVALLTEYQVWLFIRTKTKFGCSYVELPLKDLLNLNNQRKNDNSFGIWCIISRLHPVKKVGKAKSFENYFNTMFTTGINLENGTSIEDIPEMEKLNTLIINVVILVEKWTAPPVFLPLEKKQEKPKEKDEENRLVDLIL